MVASGKNEIITIRGLNKTFGSGDTAVTALSGIDLTIYEGEIFGIIGLSGAGKSTLVRCMNYLEKPTDGSVVIAGQALEKLQPGELLTARRNMGMIFQQFNLLMQKNAIQNICFPLEIAGVPKAQAVKRARELLEVVELQDKEKAYPAQLSGGQKQRVAIAGVMAMRPRCIVLDEPTAMLDPNGRKEVIKTVRELNRQEGITVLLITHYMEEVIHADRVIVMDDGHVVMDGTPREIFSRTEELKKYRLDVPQVTELAWELKKAGVPLSDGILDREEFLAQILPLLQKEG